MAKEKNFDFYDWLLLFGGLWMLSKIFKNAEEAGIGGVPKALRKLWPCKMPDGTEPFRSEMAKLKPLDFQNLIALIVSSRVAIELKEPIYKPFAGSKLIDGEFRDIGTGFRIFVKKLPKGNFMMLSFYKKQTDKTPQNEISKAEQRAKNCTI